jgi:Icc protein
LTGARCHYATVGATSHAVDFEPPAPNMNHTGQPPTPPEQRPEQRARTLRVLQLTDTHLFASTDETLLGMNTQQSFDQCLRLAQQQHGPADLILATGDLVHDGSTAGYGRLRRLLLDMNTDVGALPGNHDDPGTLQSVLCGGAISGARSVCRSGWQIILLDSTVPGSDSGRLSASELAELSRHLQQRSQDHALVCLHHAPVTIDSRWIDSLRLENPDEFFAVLDSHPQVRAVVWGHIHQDFGGQRNGVQLLGAPSTCIQFKPNSDRFALDLQPPGYRWLMLHADGSIETGIERLSRMPPGVDLHRDGY